MHDAQSASGERVEATLVPTPAPAPAQSENSTPGDLDRLREILLGDELGALDTLHARIEKLDRAQHDLAERLPDAIERAGDSDAPRIAHALARPVAAALGTAVRENRQVIVDVLFPVIGPAIRKAIAEALRHLVADMNGAIESSLTPRGIMWRIEAWRCGMPYAQVVLKHTLNYGIDHVFLIERDSGLVLDRESAPHLPELDGDAIAGMLTAIGEFVRDSVDREGGGTLDAARVGDRLLWVVQGPRANLACFIHGVPPSSLYALLEQRLEEIHTRLGERLDAGSFDDASRESLQPARIVRDALAADAAPQNSTSPWPMRVVLLAVLALAAWFVVRHEMQSAWIAQLRADLSAHPGFALTGIDARRGAVTVHGLVDPDAEPIEPSARSIVPAETALAIDTLGYISTDDAIIARRARRLLAPPASITISARAGVLTLSGHAPAAWIDGARERAAWIAGVRNVEFAAAADTDAAAQARAQLATLARTIADEHVAFVRDVEPASAALDALVADALRAQQLAALAGVGINWIAVGTNDDPGSNSINTRLRAERARWLADALLAHGVEHVEIAADDDAAALAQRQRGAFVRLILADKPR